MEYGNLILLLFLSFLIGPSLLKMIVAKIFGGIHGTSIVGVGLIDRFEGKEDVVAFDAVSRHKNQGW